MHLLLKNSLMELENTRCPLEQFSLSKMNQGKRSGREIFLLLYVPNFPPLPHFKSCEKMELSAKCTTAEVWKSAKSYKSLNFCASEASNGNSTKKILTKICIFFSDLESKILARKFKVISHLLETDNCSLRSRRFWERI